ncbi:MAG TPA: hypothetical protein DEG43_05200 [Acidimicrobiaceae bacterium]|nr:hypothetical protein [Acidimicrobiaceae bacterium]
MRSLLAKAGGTHPLAHAALSHLDGDYAAAETTLMNWAPDEPVDRALRATLLSAAAMGSDQIDRAIQVLEQTVQTDPDSSGVGLRAAEMILSRARFGVSLSVLRDYARARQLALAARDSRRGWAGDSVAAILVALNATALAGDLDDAWRLLAAAPEGEATSAEAMDPRLIGERATLAALMGSESTALELLDAVASKCVQSMVRGWIAHGKGDFAQASEQWLEAWQQADSDLDRNQAAAALAPLGGAMPDLGELAKRHPETVAGIKTIHEVMSTPGNRVPLLRARAHESEQLTILLVDVLSESGDQHGAAEVLREGALRWKHPLMMKMAANRLLAAGDSEAALGCSADALQLAGREWAGELDTLGIMFHAQESLARHHEALLTARRMVELAPENLSARWVLVQCLVRNGDLKQAWAALKYKGEPVSPRTSQEVRTWIGLLSKYDTSTFFLSRALKVFDEWSADAEIQGVILLNIHGRSMLHELTPTEIEALQTVTGTFLATHPTNAVFRNVVSGPEDDPLQAIENELKLQATPPPLMELEQRIRKGELPFGLGAEVFNRSYTECAIIRISGLVYSDATQFATTGLKAASEALGSPVVLDSTAAVTLARLDEATARSLVGSFSFIDSTVVAYRDALNAQESLAMRSTMSIYWNDEAQRVMVNQITDDVAEGRSRCAERVLSVLDGARRANWQRLEHVTTMGTHSSWLSALDYAIDSGESFWCDDYLLRSIALSKGVAAFSTVDLLRHLVSAGRLAPHIGRVAESVLVANYYVDLGFDAETMRLAATLDRWLPAGAAASLARPMNWANSNAALAFVLDAVKENAEGDPVAVQGWIQLAAEGLIRVAGEDACGAYGNVRLLLARAIGHTAQVRALLPFLIAGIRFALSQFPGIDDPLGEVLGGVHSKLIEQFGHASAAALLMGMVSNTSSDDQNLAARIILTTPM